MRDVRRRPQPGDTAVGAGGGRWKVWDVSGDPLDHLTLILHGPDGRVWFFDAEDWRTLFTDHQPGGWPLKEVPDAKP